MKLRSVAFGAAAVGALFMVSGIAAWAQADMQTAPAQQKRAITPPPVTAPTDAARSATESAVRNARDDAYRRAKARRERLAALKHKRHAKRKVE
jgi:hypothetical protein